MPPSKPGTAVHPAAPPLEAEGALREAVKRFRDHLMDNELSRMWVQDESPRSVNSLARKMTREMFAALDSSPTPPAPVDADRAAVEAVVEAAKLFRDAWREDHSHIPPLEQTRDMAPYLIRLWGAISDLETLRSKA